MCVLIIATMMQSSAPSASAAASAARHLSSARSKWLAMCKSKPFFASEKTISTSVAGMARCSGRSRSGVCSACAPRWTLESARALWPRAPLYASGHVHRAGRSRLRRPRTASTQKEQGGAQKRLADASRLRAEPLCRLHLDTAVTTLTSGRFFSSTALVRKLKNGAATAH